MCDYLECPRGRIYNVSVGDGSVRGKINGELIAYFIQTVVGLKKIAIY